MISGKDVTAPSSERSISFSQLRGGGKKRKAEKEDQKLLEDKRERESPLGCQAEQDS